MICASPVPVYHDFVKWLPVPAQGTGLVSNAPYGVQAGKPFVKHRQASGKPEACFAAVSFHKRIGGAKGYLQHAGKGIIRC